MTSDLDKLDDAPGPRDYTKWVWAGVLVLFAVLGGALYANSGLDPQVSIVRGRHILIKFDATDPAERGRALDRIRDIRERVLKGEDFGKLARDNSNDPGSASKGGDLGFVTKGELNESIDQYLWTAPIGQLSEIITTGYGFHIVVVDDRRLSDFDALKEQQKAQSTQTPAPPQANP